MPATPVITELEDLYDVPALADGEGIVKQDGVLTAVALATQADIDALSLSLDGGTPTTVYTVPPEIDGGTP